MIKEKWATCHYENCFKARISTASRAESFGATIKLEWNSISEIFNLIETLEALEGVKK